MSHLKDISYFNYMIPGIHFINDVLLAFQIRWRLRIAVITLLGISWEHKILRRVQNFVAITDIESTWE